MPLGGYHSLQPCLDDLEAKGDLVRIEAEVDPVLEMGCIQRRVYAARGPALLFTRVKGTPFPMVGNLFGTRERIRFIFRHTLPLLERVMNTAADPGQALRRPQAWIDAARAAWKAGPQFVSSGPILRGMTRIRFLPNLVSWPGDGGGYATLPQVYTEDPDRPGWRHSNLGMYRVQLTGGGYVPDQEVGLHYQIHRGIGPHHARALELGRELPVNVCVGGPPAMTLAAIMPLPEGMPEIALAGILSGSRIRLVRGPNGLPMPAEADFCICGHIVSDKELPEGPFGDHLGYYSLAHDFPVMRVQTVYHRPGAVWPFTTVGRPPQEDTEFGSLIHELTGPVIPKEFPGVREVHAVDEAGVHPLLLAVASERYVPFVPDRRPQELLTTGLGLLGRSQTSLSKYLFIVDRADAPKLSARDVPAFFRHVLERADWTRDLHFVTRTTMDTLDYSGISLNQGSKLLVACRGPRTFNLVSTCPGDLPLSEDFGRPGLFDPGILVLSGPKHDTPRDSQDPAMDKLGHALNSRENLGGIRLVVVADDPAFVRLSWRNFLWTTFTRSDPATDIYGLESFTHCKHWGCRGALVIDARAKAFHAPVLEEDPDVVARVEALAAPGEVLHGFF